MLRTINIIAIAGALAGIGCASTEPSVREQRMDAVEDHADKHADMVERQREYDVDRAENVAEMQEDKVEVIEDRNVFATNAQSRLDKLAIRIDEAEKKAAIQDEATEVNFKQELNAAKQQHDELEGEVEQIDSVEDADWEQARTSLDDKLASLEDRVDKLISLIEEA